MKIQNVSQIHKNKRQDTNKNDMNNGKRYIVFKKKNI